MDFFVKFIKNRFLLLYYKLTGQNDLYQIIQDRILTDSIICHEQVFNALDNDIVFEANPEANVNHDALPGDGEGDTTGTNDSDDTVQVPDTDNIPADTYTTNDRGVFWGDINKFKYMLIDSPVLRTSIALSAFFIVKYSTRVLISNIIN